MTSHTSLFVVYVFIIGLNIAHGRNKYYANKVNEECMLDIADYGGHPGDKLGFWLRECDASLFMHCVDDDTGTYSCQCAYKPVDEKDNKGTCVRPPSVKKYGELCSYLQPCYNPFVCPSPMSNPYEPDTCRCPEDTPKHVGNGCEKLQYGEACKKSIQCITGTCLGSKCACPPEKPNWNEKKKYCTEALHGDPCGPSKLCSAAAGLSCVDGKCACAGKKRKWDDVIKECVGSDLGEECTSNDQCLAKFLCYEGKCGCGALPAVYDEEKKVCSNLPNFGEVCRKRDGEQECSDPSLICVDEGGKLVCRCKHKTFGWDAAAKKCVPRRQGGDGAKCKDDSDCLGGTGLKCTNGVCRCQGKDVWHKGTCEIEDAIQPCNIGIVTGACRNPFGENFQCNKEHGVCTCGEQYQWAHWAQACKLKAGQNCKFDNTLYHDLCAGQHCDENGKCACGENPVGFPQIWSYEPDGTGGCIPNLHRNPCAMDSGVDECAPPPGTANYNTSRPGLRCVEEKCECDQGLNFMQGHCIDAKMNHGTEACDRRFGDTCRVDTLTSLTCVADATGKLTCACLPQVNHPAIVQETKTQSVQLTWYEDTGKCDLKKVGAKCNHKYECRSQLCPPGTGICTARPRRRGAANQIQTSIVLVTAPAAFILFNFLYN